MVISNQLMPITQADEVGEIIHLARSGRLIVKLSAVGAERVKSGELLIDGSGRKVGRVAELIGPVRTPYASVITMTDRTSRLVGSKVFGGGFAKKPRNQTGGFGRRRSSSRQEIREEKFIGCLKNLRQKAFLDLSL